MAEDSCPQTWSVALLGRTKLPNKAKQTLQLAYSPNTSIAGTEN